MRKLAVVAMLGLVLGCGDKDDDDTGSDTDTDTDADADYDFEDLVFVTDAPTGNSTCFVPGSDWLTQTVDPSKQVTASFTHFVEDFESDDPVVEANVDLYYGDALTQPDASGATDQNGNVTLETPVCTPFMYRTWKNPELDEVKTTIEAHQIYTDQASVNDSPLNSVSKATYDVILALFGIASDPAKGSVAGTVYDCDEEPIENAQVVIRPVGGGDIPSGIVMGYMGDEFPNRDQKWTSEDGLFLISLVPPGDWQIEAYTYNGTDYDLIGQTEITVKADSINISNIYNGFGDGVKFPADCLAE